MLYAGRPKKSFGLDEDVKQWKDLEFIWSIDKGSCLTVSQEAVVDLQKLTWTWNNISHFMVGSSRTCHASTRDRNLRPITSPVAARLNRGNERKKEKLIIKKRAKYNLISKIIIL